MKRIALTLLHSGIFLAALLGGTAPPARAQGSAAAAAPSVLPRTAPAEKLTIAGIPNAGRVSEFLYRGAQPHPEGFAALKDLGIAIVVDLHNRGLHEEQERLAVESRGMRYVSIPVRSSHSPSDAQIAQFLKLVRDNPWQKIFVHCRLGADRTGVMIAAFRMAEQQWTPEQALAEMRRFHFHHLWLPAMSRAVRNFPNNFETDPVFAGLHSPTRAH